MSNEEPAERVTGPSDTSQSIPLHVVCSLRSSRDRELLVEWLKTVEDVTVSTASPEELVARPFDLCVIDQSALQSVGDQLLARVEREEPLSLPCLLFANRTPKPVAGGEAAEIPKRLRPLVTEVIEPPVRKAALRRRLNVVLRIRRQSKQLADSKAHHEELLELLPEAVLLLTNGEIEYANTAAVGLFDTDGTGVVGDRFLDYIADDDRAAATAFLDRTRAGETTLPATESEYVELAVRIEDTIRELEVSGTAVGLDGDTIELVCRDMTSRNRRAAQLELYETVMDEASVGITITDARELDNPLVYVNRRFEELTGRDREWMLGENPRFAQSPRTDPTTVESIRQAVEAGKPISVELINQREDGTEWDNALDISPVYQDGELTHFLGFQRDVTATRTQQNQLAVLDRVLRHNLRNRLNVILGHSETLTDGPPTEAVPLHASTICETAQDLLSLSDKTRRFRAALESDSETTARMDLAPIISECLTVQADETPDAVFDCELSDEVRIQSRNAVRFVLTELLANAVEHADTQTPHVSVSVTETDGEACIRITDDGPGIPESERQAFENTTETPTDHAIGMGLWLVRWAINAAGGELDYAEADPQGSIITVRLPAVSTSEAESDGNPEEHPDDQPDEEDAE